ncbi:MAG TPA: hypothetical protein PL010_15500 [Flavobacteriales bacterium]|nr:hypothetical protein [Flavobacteriales bacterium]MCC6655126.1 hypothetical protein [Flavobacteriales bacterium]HMW98032.1 hypothetical protein [Flavobacteriales bacterium]HNA33097.1 hypothetical protein [Flavobacteriales bacterium]HNE81102.1 hypothetical protein [Flavobacteriales bacterium]
MRMFQVILTALVAQGIAAQTAPTGSTSHAAYVVTEEISLAMNKAQIIQALPDAWGVSFAQEPGAHLGPVDVEGGIAEGQARVNYRSKLLTGREETMGTITYRVTIQAHNGRCIVRVHDLRHTGNRNAIGGGIHAGPILEGTAPDEGYPGMGLGSSRRIHADIRGAADARIRETIRRFAGRLRTLAGE